MLPLSTSIKLKKSNPHRTLGKWMLRISTGDRLCAVERLGDQRNRRLPAITPSRKSNAQKDHKNPWNAVRATAGHSFALYILSLESSFHYRRIPAPT